MDKKLSLTVLSILVVSGLGFYLLKSKHGKSPAGDSEATLGELDSASSGKEEAPKQALALVHSAPLSQGDKSEEAGKKPTSALPPSPKAELVGKLIQMQKHDFDNVRNFITSSMQEITEQMTEDLAEEAHNPEEQQELLSKISKVTEEALTYIETEIEKTYAEEFSEEELAKLIALQQDPVVQKVKESSAMAGDYQDFKAEYQQFLAALPDNPPSKQREAVVREIVENSNIKEVFENINSSLGGFAGASDPQLSPQDKAAQEAAFDQQVKELKEQSYQGMLFSLREVDDPQIGHYGEVLKTDVMKKSQEVQRKLIPKLMDKPFKSIMQLVEET